MSDSTPTSKKSSRPAEEILLDLNFVPQWAKKEPSANHYAFDARPERRPSRDYREGPSRYDDRRTQQRSGERRPQRNRSEDRGGVPSGGQPPQGRPEQSFAGPRTVQPARREFVPRPQFIELPVEIKFLPDQKMLASLVRQIHHSNRAYPLMDLAHIFLSDPRGHMVKIEIKPGAGEFKLYQGKRSKIVATSRDLLLREILEDHLEDFFAKEEISVDPPKGIFPMIGKVDDILIAPTNHHSYAGRLEEVHRMHYANMSFDQFKQRVQAVHDDALVERWKEEASCKTVYRLVDDADGKEFSLSQAEEYVRAHLADTEIEEVSRAVLPSALARKITDQNLLRMVREAWQAESRFPISLSFALRAAFRHLHLFTFKAGKNINFITAVKPEPIAPGKTVENIRIVLEGLAGHPGSTRPQLLEGLRPGAEEDSPEGHEILDPIRWLVDRGHIIEFFNGTLSVPSHHRPRARS